MSRLAMPLALAATMLLPSCALLGPGSIDETGPGVMRTTAASPESASARVAPGFTKQQVTAALGPANVVRFDSGWEVWVYRWLGKERTARDATELVMLFDEQGRVRKTRLRSAPRELPR